MIESTSVALYDTLTPITKQDDLIEICSMTGGGKTKTLIEAFAHAAKKLHAENPKSDNPPVALFIAVEEPREWVITRLAATMLQLWGEEAFSTQGVANTVNQQLEGLSISDNVVILDMSPNDRNIKDAIDTLKDAVKKYNVVEIFADFGGGWTRTIKESKELGDPDWVPNETLVRRSLKEFSVENQLKLWFTSQATHGLLSVSRELNLDVLANAFSEQRQKYPSVDAGVFVTHHLKSNWVPDPQGLDLKYETYVL